MTSCARLVQLACWDSLQSVASASKTSIVVGHDQDGAWAMLMPLGRLAPSTSIVSRPRVHARKLELREPYSRG